MWEWRVGKSFKCSRQWSPYLRVTVPFKVKLSLGLQSGLPPCRGSQHHFLSGLLPVSICLLNKAGQCRRHRWDWKVFISVVDVVELIPFLKEENQAYGSK